MLITNCSLTHHGPSSKYKMPLLFPEQKEITNRLYFVASIAGAGNREGKFYFETQQIVNYSLE